MSVQWFEIVKKREREKNRTGNVMEAIATKIPNKKEFRAAKKLQIMRKTKEKREAHHIPWNTHTHTKHWAKKAKEAYVIVLHTHRHTHTTTVKKVHRCIGKENKPLRYRTPTKRQAM